MATNRFGALNILPSNIRDITDIEDVKKFLEDLTFSLNMGIKRLEEGVIDTRYISDYAVTRVKIADYTITGDKIANATITADQIADATITGDKIANATITADNIEDATITADQIADASITGSKIANATITGALIANSTITGGLIANDAITTGHIGDLAITAAKIDNLTITAAKIANETITGSKVASSTLGKDKLSFTVFDLDSNDLDDIDDGSSYAKVLKTDISAGHIVLSTCIGDLDDIDDGSSYGKVLATDISSGHIKLTECIGSIDDIDDGTSYGRVSITDISSGHILLSTCEGSLDDIDDGTNYGKVASTAISAGKIVLTGGAGVTGELPATHTEADVTQTVIDGGLVTTGYLRSNNWASSTGTQLELNDETLKFGGSGVTADGDQAGIFFGKDSGEYKAFIGNTTKNIKYDPTNGVQLNGELVVNGNIVDEEIRPIKLIPSTAGTIPEAIYPVNPGGTTETTYELIAQMVIARSGTYRVQWSFYASQDSATAVYTRVYKNGSAYGSEFSVTHRTTKYVVHEDLSFSSGDRCQIYGKTASSLITLLVQDFWINSSNSFSRACPDPQFS